MIQGTKARREPRTPNSVAAIEGDQGCYISKCTRITPENEKCSDSAQAWTREDINSKSICLRVSSSTPQRGQVLSVPQWWSEGELQTGT